MYHVRVAIDGGAPARARSIAAVFADASVVHSRCDTVDTRLVLEPHATLPLGVMRSTAAAIAPPRFDCGRGLFQLGWFLVLKPAVVRLRVPDPSIALCAG
jgi:hypothetical protein